LVKYLEVLTKPKTKAAPVDEGRRKKKNDEGVE